MPVRYTLAGSLFRMDLEGNYTPEDIVAAFHAALRDPDFPRDPRFLFDVTRSEELAKRDPAIIRAVADYFGEHSDRVGGRCAIVAAEPVHFGLSRMAAVTAEMRGAEVRVFTIVEDALSWLGVESDSRR